VKLLFDHNLSPALINRLKDLYADSSHVYNLNLDQVPDTEVWQYARREDFLIVTKDAGRFQRYLHTERLSAQNYLD
jgi:predicted nuclease of predicted toxin-antitoxin system